MDLTRNLEIGKCLNFHQYMRKERLLLDFVREPLYSDKQLCGGVL